MEIDMEIICYACGKEEYPENTLEAIDHCRSVNPSWPIEMDIQMTKDGQLVLFHDRTTDRVTGKPGILAEMSLKELTSFNAGYSFEINDQYPYRESPITIPLLEEVLVSFAEAKLVLDISSPDPQIVPCTCDLIKQYGKTQDVIIVSQYDSIIADFKSQLPGIRIAAGMNEVKRITLSSKLYLDGLFPIKTDYLMIPEYYGRIKMLSKRIVKHVHDRHKKLVLWRQEVPQAETYKDAQDVERLARIGVDGLFTGSPRQLSESLTNHGTN